MKILISLNAAISISDYFFKYSNHLQEDLTADQRERSLTDPGLFEMIGFSFFPGGFLIGPQVPSNTFYSIIKLSIFNSTLLSGWENWLKANLLTMMLCLIVGKFFKLFYFSSIISSIFICRYIAAFKELLLGSVVLGFQQYFSTFYNYQFYTTNQFQVFITIY